MTMSFVSKTARTAVLSIGAAVAVFATTAASADTIVRPDVTTASIAVKPQRYCFGTVATGSVITHNVCKTGPEWRRLGVEPNAFAKYFRRASTGSRVAIVDGAR